MITYILQRCLFGDNWEDYAGYSAQRQEQALREMADKIAMRDSGCIGSGKWRVIARVEVVLSYETAEPR
jgi:hypothetical protein